jgi:hypothetical protein
VTDDSSALPALIHGIARLVRDTASAAGVRFWIAGGMADGAVRGAEDLPGHALELHVFRDSDMARGFAHGVSLAGGNSVAAAGDPWLAVVLVAYLDRERTMPPGASLDDAVPIARVYPRDSCPGGDEGEAAGHALRAARETESLSGQRRADDARRRANRDSWAPLAHALSLLPRMTDAGGKPRGVTDRIQTAVLKDAGHSAARAEIFGSFDPLGAWREENGGQVRQHTVWAERHDDAIVLLTGSDWGISAACSAPRTAAFQEAAIAAGWIWDPDTVCLRRVCAPDASDVGNALLAYPALARAVLALAEECHFLSAARTAIAEQAGMRMLGSLAADPGYRLRQYRQGQPARLDTARGGRDIPGKLVQWADKLGFLDTVSQEDTQDGWWNKNLVYSISGLGQIAVGGDVEALAAGLRKRKSG